MDEDENVEVQPDPPPRIEEAMGNLNLDHHLSYNALKGSSDLGTMKFSGTINGR